MNRRDAIKTLASAAVATATPWSRVDAQQAFRFGYAAITWGGNDRQAMADIEAVGFRGIQLRTAAVDAFAERTSELKELLARHHLTLVALSSGNLGIDPALEAEEMARHTRHARFVREVGGHYLQIIDSRPKRAISAGDYAAMGRRLTELGKRTADIGIPLGYHHHMGSLGEAPDEIERILTAVDPHYVKLELDVAHYLQGGGDPAAAIRTYGSQILFLHLKDVEPRIPPAGEVPPRPYRFVELGRGRVDLPGVIRALGEVAFKGWIVIELDAVPDGARSPKEAAQLNHRYVTERLGLTI
ncbi:MAG TPA: TIM barrel protein [Vicinamibacterales bacterium]|jgi:inosose dehydratase